MSHKLHDDVEVLIVIVPVVKLDDVRLDGGQQMSNSSSNMWLT